MGNTAFYHGRVEESGKRPWNLEPVSALFAWAASAQVFESGVWVDGGAVGEISYC